jgi:predicted RNase H-like HicB family nuclease
MVSNKVRSITLELTVLVRKEGEQYSSWCPELDVASCGDTIEEACANLDDAVDLYLETLRSEGELLNVLAERGLTPPGNSGEKNTCNASFLSSRRVTVRT